MYGIATEGENGMGDLLTVSNLSKRFHGYMALDGLSMRIPEGAIYGFIGKNGAGKTTLIKIICGLLHADGGTYSLSAGNGADGSQAAAVPRVGAIAGEPAMYGDMTAEENMLQQYRILGLPTFDGIAETLRLVGLADTGKKKARHFSQGMRQKLGIAMALAGEPAFLVLDEPMNGLDPQGIRELRELILSLNRERHVTFLISSHILGELARIATHYGFIDRGRMLAEMTADELAQLLTKSLRVKVSSTEVLARVLDRRKIGYRILSDTEADVFSDISVTQLAAELMALQCEIYSCCTRDERLDEYFLHLVEDVQNA